MVQEETKHPVAELEPVRSLSRSVSFAADLDPTIAAEADKADKIVLWDFVSVQGRAFHLAWFGFFTAFTAWFSIAPLMPVIKKSLHLTKDQVNYANLASVSTTIFARVLFGPLSDRFGPKRTMSAVLLLGAIPVFCVGSISTWQHLVAVRSAIGLLGASFVMSQSWTSNMFSHNVVGTANAIVGGWGNLGGGLTQVLMVDIYQAFLDNGVDKEQAWRRAFFVPGCLLIVVAALVYFLGQDTPRGDISTLNAKANSTATGATSNNTARDSMWMALSELPTYILAIQYAASFGVEITAFNMVATYFHETYGVSVVRAGQIALLSGVTNLFARAMGGMLSDWAFREVGMKGRLVMQFLLVLCEGIFLIFFANCPSFHMATIVLVVFSIFVQAANGSCFSIVPYVSPYKGSVSGIVGAGGNIGAMIFSLLFIFGKFETTAQGYYLMGWAVMIASFTIFFIRAGDLKEYTKLQQHGKAHVVIDATTHVDEEEGLAKPVRA